MSTALVGDFLLGVQPLWPPSPVTLADVFDSPTWTRPTPDTGYTPPDGAEETFTGAPGFTGGGTFSGAPGFDGAPTDGSFWAVGDSADPDDGGTITVVTPDGSVVSMNIRASRRVFYTIEVRDPDGDRLSVITEWTRGTLRRVLDSASELSFKVPYNAEGVAELVRPNTIWLRDRWGYVIGTYQIQKRRPMGSGDESYYEIEAIDAIAQLGDEVVIQYAEDAAGTTVEDHVTALLALQVRDGALTLGRIDPEIADIELPLYQSDTTIHAALLALQAALPREFRGRFYVDARRRFQWRLLPGDQTEQVITRAANVRAISAETDYTALVNRLYMYGEGQDVTDRLSLLDAGEAEAYLEDAASITTWGVCPAIKVDRRIRYPETLLRVAQRILEEYSQPPTVVEVELLDLAKSDDAPLGWQDIDIGGKYRVVDSDLGIDTSVEIVAIETDLARPVPVRVELANQTRRLSDLISTLVDALQQPLDVDGDRYPTMGRNYSTREPREPRAGDVRWNADDDRAEMHDGTDWQPVGSGGIPLYTATSKAGLQNTGVEAYALGFVTAGAQQGAWFERNADNTAWIGRTIWEVP